VVLIVRKVVRGGLGDWAMSGTDEDLTVTVVVGWVDKKVKMVMVPACAKQRVIVDDTWSRTHKSLIFESLAKLAFSGVSVAGQREEDQTEERSSWGLHHKPRS
jgi:hypothetical protein